jgi:O-antigen ligase
MTQKTEQLNKWRENVFFLSLIIFVAVFPFSEALVSISAGLILLQALVLLSWQHPSVEIRSRTIVFFPLSVFLVYITGTLFTHDLPFALYEWKKTIFWVVIPLAVFLSPQLKEKQTCTVLLVFTASVILSSFFAAGRLILHEHSMISDFRSVSIVSHIRFSLQVVLSIIILAWFLIFRKYRKFHINPGLLILLCSWLICFLFLLKSLLGFISFLGTLAFVLIYYFFRLKDLRKKTILLAAFFVVFLIPAFFVGKVLFDFYDFKDVDPETVEYLTPSGNRYHHDFQDKTRENGHLVFVYICEDELRQEWNKRSNTGYDDLLNDFPLSITLIRYLTSLGYRKDSTGVNQLSAEDVTLIAKGITNYKFKNRYFSIYPRIYETIWEIDNYIRSGDPNKKSLAQRIEFVKASVILIKNNPLFGFGTGNWVMKYDEVYDQMKTKLSDDRRGPSHNQYLNYMVKFGIIGFLYILFAVLYPFFRTGHRQNFMFILFLVSYAFANLGDANMETHMGLSFFTLFYSIFLWNSTGEMKKSV